MPNPQEFHQHLRALAQSAVKQVIETVMIEELDALIGAAWGECSPKRKGYRNASYTRDLITSTGKLEDVKVPRDREGQFHTQAFERYQRGWQGEPLRRPGVVEHGIDLGDDGGQLPQVRLDRVEADDRRRRR